MRRATSWGKLVDADVYWMTRALEQAIEAAAADEVPVGAVIVRDAETDWGRGQTNGNPLVTRPHTPRWSPSLRRQQQLRIGVWNAPRCM